MKATLDLDPKGIYTGAQAIEATGIPKRTFYQWVKEGRIPKHMRKVDSRTVFLGSELIRALTATVTLVDFASLRRPTRGRPKKVI